MTEIESKLLRSSKRRFFLNELRRKRTRQGRFDARCLHLDHPLFAGGPIIDPSDHGAGADAIRDVREGPPLWRHLWANERKALKPRHRAVLDALLVDQRPRVAARLAGVSKDQVYACMNTIFPIRFAAAYRALVLAC